MGGCQNYGAFLGTLNIRCGIITGVLKGTIILTTTHMSHSLKLLTWGYIWEYYRGFPGGGILGV